MKRANQNSQRRKQKILAKSESQSALNIHLMPIYKSLDAKIEVKISRKISFKYAKVTQNLIISLSNATESN